MTYEYLMTEPPRRAWDEVIQMTKVASEFENCAECGRDYFNDHVIEPNAIGLPFFRCREDETTP